ncbi:MAG: DUF3488 domain-containing protein, partial [Magnetococcales bacterium]|nr:DUF3488 domain-containing protein [Magnetococcales bacterium]
MVEPPGDAPSRGGFLSGSRWSFPGRRFAGAGGGSPLPDWDLERWVSLGFVPVLILVILPQAPHLPVGIVVMAIFFLPWWGWQVHLSPRPPLGNRWLRGGMIGLILLLVFGGYGKFFGRDPGVALLVGLMLIKLLEFKSRRDPLLVVFLGYFLTLSLYFRSQSILMAIHTLAVAALLTALLIALSGTVGQWRRLPRLVLTLMFQALPVMLVLFLGFPRIGGPLWGVPEEAFATTSTGLSEVMTPGDGDRLTGSLKVAFRVRFEGEAPAAPDRYWRAMVLWYFDGRSWRLGQFADAVAADDAEEGRIEGVDAGIAYGLTLEPHNLRWLPTLEMPVGGAVGVRLRGDYTIKLERPLTRLLRYRLVSHSRYRTVGGLSHLAR